MRFGNCFTENRVLYYKMCDLLTSAHVSFGGMSIPRKRKRYYICSISFNIHITSASRVNEKLKKKNSIFLTCAAAYYYELYSARKLLINRYCYGKIRLRRFLLTMHMAYFCSLVVLKFVRNKDYSYVT